MNMFERIQELSVDAVIFDIDGTLKDLCKEHTVAVEKVLQTLNVSCVSKKIITFVNFWAMCIVKLGLFPTNRTSQNILIWLFAIIARKNLKFFKGEYFKHYTKQVCLFEEVYSGLKKVNIDTYFATINKQNYNMEHYGICCDKIICSENGFKFITYKKLIESKGLTKKRVLIVGDNVFDDLLSAKLLGTKSLLVNNYNSKFKKIICKLLNGR